jgi:hypothetical protein
VRYLVVAVVLVFSTSGVARADGGLTDAVASAYFVRTVDAQLHEIAHARAAEIAAAGTLSHDGGRDGTAEVLAWNRGMEDPVSRVVSLWLSSSGHNAILSDRSYGRIGCAEKVVGDVHWFACVLAFGPLPAQPAQPAPPDPEPATTAARAGAEPPTLALPDTSVPLATGRNR